MHNNNSTETIPFISRSYNKPQMRIDFVDLLKEARNMFYSWLPIFISFVMQGMVYIINIILLGQLGPKTLAAGGLAGFIVTSTGVAPLLGFITAQDTLCAQAFTGCSNQFTCGLILQKTIVMILLIFTPVAILWCNIKSLIILAVHNEEIASVAQSLLRYYAICVPIIFISESIKKYLQSQRIFKPGVYVSSLVSMLHLITASILSLPRFLNYGHQGVMFSFLITSLAGLLLLVLYIKFVDGYQCWGGFEPRKWFKNMKSFIKLGVSGALIAAGEMAPSEVVSFASSFLGQKYLSAQSSLGSINFMAIMCYNSLSITSTIYIGNYIGSGSVLKAKRAVYATFLLFSIFFVVLFVFTNVFKHGIASVFSSDIYIREIIVSLLPFVAFCQLFLGLANICGGVLKGQARQHVSAVFKLFGAYVLAIPISLCLAKFTELKLLGLWTGLAINWIFCSIGEVFYIYNSNWEILRAII